MQVQEKSNSIEIEEAVLALSKQLRVRGWKIAAAESCTGGGIAKALTELSGSSVWFERGFVTYSNESKMELLGVLEKTLQQQGAVSEATVCEMVGGALTRSRAEVAVAVSGIAGPDGGSSEKPVGLVWFGWQGADGHPVCEKRIFSGNRRAVREQTILTAVEGLQRLVTELNATA